MQKPDDSNHIQFFTATILEWKHLLISDNFKNIIIESLMFLTTEKRAEIFGFVIMPNHIHLIWRINNNLKRDDVQRDFLKYTSQQILKLLKQSDLKLLEQFKVNAKDRKYQIWERNALSIDVYSREVLEQKLIYIHNNPMQDKWKLASEIGLYKYSSFNFYENDLLNWTFLKHYINEI